MKRARSLGWTLPLLAGSVALTGIDGARPAFAQRQTPRPTTTQRTVDSDRVVIPAETVVRVKLDEAINSRNTKVGDRFEATLAANDRSGFPDGTRFEGSVSEVQRSTDDRPGVLDMRFNRAILPDGRNVTVDGRLASLSDDDTRRAANGRVEARRRSNSNRIDPKWVGYGAAGGAVLAEIFGSNFLKGALLGGLGGAVYAYLNRDKDGDRRDFRDVTLDRGTEFGIRLTNRVAFNEDTRYRYAARNDRYYDRPARNERVAGARNEYRFSETVVTLDDRRVELQGLRAMNINGQLYVPLMPIAESAGWKVQHRTGDDFFSLTTAGNRRIEGYTGDPSVSLGDNRTERLEDAPILIDGDVYVPTEFLNRAGEMRVRWNRASQRLELQSYRP